MKIIVSHDVDHISFREHWLKDLFAQKWLAKNVFAALTGKVSLALASKRLAAVFSPRLHRVPELMAFDREFGVPSTFFVGMANALGMSYSLQAATAMVRQIQNAGFAVGVHGVAYQDSSLIQQEYERFQVASMLELPFGVRNHYLRFSPETPVLQAAAGYLFDSSEYGMNAPYRVNGLIEFPVCLMDSYLLSDCRNDLEDVKKRTLAAFQEGERLGLPFFTIIFHDPYYSELFPVHQAWYRWLVKYLKDYYELTDFARAGQQLKGI
jgi:hypothetical protein